jgi:hypothetical protein
MARPNSRTVRATDEAGGLEANPPEGGLFHVAGPMPGGWRVVDIWESEEAFERFAGERPIPAVQQVGVPDMPNPEFYPIEGVWLAEWDVSRLLTTD